MVDEGRSDWYYDSDSTSSGPASQSRLHSDWQNAVDSNGNVFYVRRTTSHQFSCVSSRNNSTYNVNQLHKTPSGFLDKLIGRRSSRRGKNEHGNISDLKSSNYGKKVSIDPKRASSTPDISCLDSAHRFLTTEPFADYTVAGMIYTTFDQLENQDSRNDVIYAFPPVDNILIPARGLFVTLLHLLPSVSSSRPTVTSFWFNGAKINVAYSCEGEDALLMGLPESSYSRAECRRITSGLSSYQKFVFQTLSRGYVSPIDNFSDLDAFFRSLFRKLDSKSPSSIQDRLHCSIPISVPYLVVPGDIQNQVEEALNELESNEIQSSTDEDRRKFSIIGTAYLYKGYTVCSHLPKDDALEAFNLLRESGILQYCYEGVKDLVFWKEVFPMSCNRGLVPAPQSPYSTPSGRWFLLTVALGHNALVLLLESGGCTLRAAVHQDPDSSYVEEAQATLRHIIKLGTAHFLSKWIGERDTQNEGKYSLGRSSQSLSSFAESLHHGSVKSFDLLDYENAVEDNMPVLGRRAERELNEISHHTVLNSGEFSEDGNSNKEAKNGDRLSESSDFGRRTVDGSLLSNHRIGSCKYDPYFHYIHLDTSEGIVLSNLFSESNCPSFLRIVDNFKIQVGHIQDVFRNTLTFQSKSNDVTSTNVNNSLVSIKEYGTLFRLDDVDGKSSVLYWVTGRLIATSSSPRELYVCHQDSCPQNLVEIAFHLALTSSR